MKKFLPLFLLICLPLWTRAQEQPQPAAASTSTHNDRPGYRFMGEVNIARAYFQDNPDFTFGFRAINAYQFSRHVSAGIGIGVDKYVDLSPDGSKVNSLTLLPVFSDFRIFVGSGNIQPYFAQSVGYAFCVDQPVDYNYSGSYYEAGGIMLQPSAGIRIRNSAKTNLLFGLGYRYQENSMVYRDPNYYQIQSGNQSNYYSVVKEGARYLRIAHYLSFNFGLSF